MCTSPPRQNPVGSPSRASLEAWRTDQLFSLLDEFSKATLQRVENDAEAQFIVEVVTSADERVTSLLLRESIVVMAAEQVRADADLDRWEAIASRFAAMIDTAAECYAAPLPVG